MHGIVTQAKVTLRLWLVFLALSLFTAMRSCTAIMHARAAQMKLIAMEKTRPHLGKATGEAVREVICL